MDRSQEGEGRAGLRMKLALRKALHVEVLKKSESTV